MYKFRCRKGINFSSQKYKFRKIKIFCGFPKNRPCKCAFQIVTPCYSRAGGNNMIISTLLLGIPACAGMTGLATALRQFEMLYVWQNF